MERLYFIGRKDGALYGTKDDHSAEWLTTDEGEPIAMTEAVARKWFGAEIDNLTLVVRPTTGGAAHG